MNHPKPLAPGSWAASSVKCQSHTRKYQARAIVWKISSTESMRLHQCTRLSSSILLSWRLHVSYSLFLHTSYQKKCRHHVFCDFVHFLQAKGVTLRRICSYNSRLQLQQKTSETWDAASLYNFNHTYSSWFKLLHNSCENLNLPTATMFHSATSWFPLYMKDPVNRIAYTLDHRVTMTLMTSETTRTDKCVQMAYGTRPFAIRRAILWVLAVL